MYSIAFTLVNSLGRFIDTTKMHSLGDQATYVVPSHTAYPDGSCGATSFPHPTMQRSLEHVWIPNGNWFVDFMSSAMENCPENILPI